MKKKNTIFSQEVDRNCYFIYCIVCLFANIIFFFAVAYYITLLPQKRHKKENLSFTYLKLHINIFSRISVCETGFYFYLYLLSLATYCWLGSFALFHGHGREKLPSSTTTTTNTSSTTSPPSSTPCLASTTTSST